MAFKGIEERFQAKMTTVYGKYSTKNGTSNHPLMEWKPNDKNARDQSNDSRMLPLGAVKRDIVRIGKWSVSGDGVMFMVKQQIQQMGNVFSETRIINPLFVVSNLVPFVHGKRPLAVPSGFAVTGNVAHRSPASTPKVGAAGRLQRETGKSASANLMGVGGRNSLLSLLPPNKIIDTVKGAFSLKDKGSMGIDERPELDFNGEYYSIALWRGFRKQHGFRDNLDSAAANLRVGNIKGATTSLKLAVSDVTQQIKGKLPKNIIIPDGRGSPTTNQDGRRYFIINATDAERYLNNSIMFDTTAEGLAFTKTVGLYRTPYLVAALNDTSINQPSTPKVDLAPVNKLRQAASPTVSNLSSKANLSNAQQIIKAANKLKNTGLLPLIESENPAEDMMIFGDRSLRKRYETDDRIEFIRSQLANQKDSQKKYWEDNKHEMGFGGTGYKEGQDITPDPRVRYFGKDGNFFDTMNTTGVVYPIKGNEPSEVDAKEIRKNSGPDLINIWFFDYENKEVIPFRAFLTTLSEKVTPDFHDTRYIGRTERNIVYAGVTRDVSFQLRVYAMSEAELVSIWHKTERLTGLCYPANYVKGFMVPPFIKLTLGDVYVNQPCYIKSLNHTIEEGTTWEIDEGKQAPHGISINVSVSIIEKNQKKSGSRFYEIAGK
jgi:hypothetical protein